MEINFIRADNSNLPKINTFMVAVFFKNNTDYYAAELKNVKHQSAVSRGKKSPTPGMVTGKAYHTLVGDPDVSWYLGLDPDVKVEDAVQDCCDASTVEVPRWREKPYTSCYTLEGTENLDDKIFEKRHQKLESEERRQLRWHMRRVREERHAERLRQRQRDPWCAGASPPRARTAYTVWPQPLRDVRYIQITDTLPVMAFGEILPALPEADFMLPWVKTSKALKRAKRCKTMY